MTSLSLRSIVMRQFELLTAPPLCGLCGTGYALTGWIVAHRRRSSSQRPLSLPTG